MHKNFETIEIPRNTFLQHYCRKSCLSVKWLLTPSSVPFSSKTTSPSWRCASSDDILARFPRSVLRTGAPIVAMATQGAGEESVDQSDAGSYTRTANGETAGGTFEAQGKVTRASGVLLRRMCEAGW